MPPLSLAPPGLRAVPPGHEYVFNRALDELEAKTLGQLLSDGDSACVARYHGGDALHVAGLTAANRSEFERQLRDALVKVSAEHATAETLVSGGREFGDSAGDAEAAVRGSFAVLPDRLP